MAKIFGGGIRRGSELIVRTLQQGCVCIGLTEKEHQPTYSKNQTNISQYREIQSYGENLVWCGNYHIEEEAE